MQIAADSIHDVNANMISQCIALVVMKLRPHVGIEITWLPPRQQAETKANIITMICVGKAKEIYCKLYQSKCLTYVISIKHNVVKYNMVLHMHDYDKSIKWLKIWIKKYIT